MPWYKETFLHALKGVGACVWFWAQKERSMDSAPGQADYKSPMVNFLPFRHFLPAMPPAPQHFLKEINPEYSLGRLMLKLKLQYFGHLMQESTHWKRL